ncbi:MAG TPA: thiamine pyrophosphate-dependent enzyme, partial [Gemmatimonadaceae bacterium]|nr:thiamine pyrophosphate-dependent enzyme [Gemmatimonadaceae bacterium]
HISLRQPRDSVARYATAHNVAAVRVDGNDVVAVANAADDAIDRMRREPGPSFIEAVTYRWRGHVGPRDDEDVGVRRKDDLVIWRKRDPVRRLYEALREAGEVEAASLEIIEREALAEVTSAWTQAEQDPFPPPESLLSRVYGKLS